jgi:UDP-2,3-diacylglucosamine pyrophosphatase LpxH
MRIFHPNRRELMQMSAGSLLAAGLWPGALAAEEKSSGKEFSFIAVNDTHYVDKDCDPWITQVFKQMKEHTPAVDFCLHVGDVSESATSDQMAAMRHHIKDFGLTVYPVVGNHDYATEAGFKAYEKEFPERMNYHFEHQGWQFIGLDSCQAAMYKDTNIQPATLQWLDDHLPKLDKKRPTVLFTHFPLSPSTKSVKLRPNNTDKVLDRFKEFNLRAVFNGHWHGLAEATVGETTITTNRCCASRAPNHDGSTEKAYFLCHAKDGKIERKYVAVKAG